MSTALTSGTISKPYTKFAPDAIWSGEALPNATTKSTSEFMAGYAQGAVAIRMEADTTVAIAAGKQLNVQLRSGSVSGTYDTTTEIYNADAGGVTYEIDDLVFEYAVGELGPYHILDVTTDADESGDDVDVYLRHVVR